MRKLGSAKLQIMGWYNDFPVGFCIHICAKSDKLLTVEVEFLSRSKDACLGAGVSPPVQNPGPHPLRTLKFLDSQYGFRNVSQCRHEARSQGSVYLKKFENLKITFCSKNADFFHNFPPKKYYLLYLPKL